jgi:hypothetical protein
MRGYSSVPDERLFQKHTMRTTFDIYFFITTYLERNATIKLTACYETKQKKKKNIIESSLKFSYGSRESSPS